ncbi:MAG: cation transporter, partial [Kamptonema sp. SIO4C4]|nr:cation transporter [Kamptonema sp. SIO4C4]
LGYGQELYFWSLIVAVLIFSLGGGLSIYEGIRSLQHPEPSHDFLVSYVVLGVAAIFEGIALFVSIREFNKGRDTTEQGFWQAIRQSKDPSAFIVICEDAAALMGLGVAFVGVLLSEIFEDAIYDGIASMIIGVLLTVVAILLVAETKGLLVGESASPETRASIKQIVQTDEAVTNMESPITFHLGPKDILLVLNIEFKDELSSDEIEAAVRRIETNIRTTHEDIQRIFIEAASVNQ